MTGIWGTILLRLFLSACLTTFSLEAFAEGAIRVGGTGTGTVLLQRLIDLYLKQHPGEMVTPIMPPMGSSGSLRALSAGAIQVAVVSGSSRPEDSDTVQVTPWLRTPLVFTGKNMVSETQLTLNKVADIYAGRTTQWDDGCPIRIIMRSERETDTKLLRALAPAVDAGITAASRRLGMNLAENDLENLSLLEKTPGSFGTIALGQLLLTESPLKPAIVDGTAPSLESLAKGKYRLEKPLYLVTARNPNPAILEFVKFLQSQEALGLARRNGFIPLWP